MTSPRVFATCGLVARVAGAGLVLGVALAGFPQTARASTSSLRLSTQQWVIVPAPVVHVADVIVESTVVNTSGTAEDVDILLPNGASSISAPNFHGQLKVSKLSSGQQEVDLTRAAMPQGSTDVAIAFKVPLSAAQTLSLSIENLYEADSVNLFLPIAGFSPSAPDLAAATHTVTISGTHFREYSRPMLPANTPWPVSIAGMPAITGSSQAGAGTDPQLSGLSLLGQDPSQQSNEWQALANLAVIACVLLLSVLGLRRGAANAVSGTSPTVGRSAVDALYGAWMRLEERYQQGAVPEAEYRSQRAKLRDRIVSLVGPQGSDDGDNGSC